MELQSYVIGDHREEEERKFALRSVSCGRATTEATVYPRPGEMIRRSTPTELFAMGIVRRVSS